MAQLPRNTNPPVYTPITVGKQALGLTVNRFDELEETGAFLVDLGELPADEIRALDELAVPEPKLKVRKRRRSAP